MEPTKEIIIPEGWTYFAHRSNTERWKVNPLEMSTITVNKGRVMSVVTEFEIHQELEHYGKKSIKSYNSGNGTPFEIRCLIPDRQYVYALPNSELKEVMLKEFYYDKRNFGGCYGQRHHSIPPEEELIVLARGNHDEVFDNDANIIWTIPKRFIDFYKEEVAKGNNRVIEVDKKTKANVM